MANFGWNEHKWERYTNYALLAGSAFSVSYFWFRINALLYLVAIWMLVCTFIHIVARIFHWLEQRDYHARFKKN